MGTNGNDIFYCHSEVSLKWGSRKGFIPQFGDSPYSFPFIRKEWVWKQRGIWAITSTPALLLWAFSWKVPKTHSFLFCFQSRHVPINASCVAHLPCRVAPLLLTVWHADNMRGNLSSTGKVTLFPVQCLHKWPPGYTPCLESHAQTHTPAPPLPINPDSLILAQGTGMTQGRSVSPTSPPVS